jgi:hypothetical protein
MLNILFALETASKIVAMSSQTQKHAQAHELDVLLVTNKLMILKTLCVELNALRTAVPVANLLHVKARELFVMPHYMNQKLEQLA